MPQVLERLVALGAALLFAGALTPAFGWVASRAGIVSAVRHDRWGSRSTPLLGGVAIVAGMVLPTLVLTEVAPTLGAVAAGVLAAFVLGLVDDVRSLPASVKLLGQIVIAGGMAIGGVRVDVAGFTPFGVVLATPLSFLLTILWFVTLMNAVNLVDNMDGLAAGIAAIAGGVLVLMAPAQPQWLGILAAALAGACLGFLIHNFAPARVYMGDAGSLALGCALGALSLLLTTRSAATNVGLAVLAPLLVLGLPIYDTALVALTRRLAGAPVGEGGRDHTSHRLTALGLGERATVLFLYGVAATFALLAMFAQSVGFVIVPFIALVVVALVIFGIFLAEAPVASRAAVSPGKGMLLGKARPLVRLGSEIALDLTLATIALISAFTIRFEGLAPEAWLRLFVEAAPIVVPIQLAAFVFSGVYRTLWRFLDVTDVIGMVRAAALGTLAAGVLMLYPLGMVGQSRAVLLLDGLLLSLLVAGSRVFLLGLRQSFALRAQHGDRRVLIVGADENGEAALRLLLQARDVSYHPAGFVDDDPGKQRRRIGGVPVLGRIADLTLLAQRQRADIVVLTGGDGDIRERVLRDCSALGIEVREFSRTF